MVNRSSQNWNIGSKVNIGFIKGLLIQSIELTPGDSKPDIYHLISDKGIKYLFTPHNGLEKA